MNAADKARQTARSAGLAGLGQAAAGVAGLYAPGGSLAGTNPFAPTPNLSHGISPYAPGYRGLPLGGVPYRYS